MDLNKDLNSIQKHIAALITALFIATMSFAQFSDYNHPELEWRSFETEHFVVHFHQGTEYTARTAAGVAEDIYEPVTSLYNYKPDGKVHFIIRDHDDYSNGGAWYYDNKIEIWAKPLDFELRGTHHWIYDVVTHEFTHIIQLGASRVGPRWMPGIYFQYINYEEEKRPDVLYGYPNRIASVPVAGTSVPMWFAEGTAQFQTEDIRHDWWDSHRDMNLRTRVLEDNLLTWNQMHVFGKTSLDAESVYNHGYSLVKFIAAEYSQEALEELSHELSKPHVISFETACKKALGVSGKELYEQWNARLVEYYSANTETIREHRVSGDLIQEKGFANIYPAFQPDGKLIAFLSNNGQDYLSLHRLVYYDTEKDTILECGPVDDATSKFIEGQYFAPPAGITESESPVKGDFDWSPDGRYIAYSRKGLPNRNGSHYNDIYIWDTEEKEDIRITKNARLATPSFSPGGGRIIAVHNTDGTHNLALITLPDDWREQEDLIDKTKWKLVTHFHQGRQIYRPVFSTGGETIYTATADLNQRDIYKFDLTAADWKDGWEPVITGKSDNRDAAVSPDGESLIFASDRTGIYNLYRYDLGSGTIQPLTNVIGGAFMPAVSAEGKIAYSEFENGGYNLRLLSEPEVVNPEYLEYLKPDEQERPDLEPTPYVEAEARDYSTPFNKLFIMPRIAWDYGKFKPGFYAYTGDLLDKLTLFAGAAIGERGERDLYLNGEYKMLYPTLFLEAFNVVRKHSQKFDDPWIIVDEYEDEDGDMVPIFKKYRSDYRFDLIELDVGARIPLFEVFTASAAYRYSRYRAAIDFDDGGSFDYTYHKGGAAIVKLDTDQRATHVANDIHPKGGYRGWIEYAYESARFLDGFEIESEKGTLVEVYKPYNYHRIEADVDYYHTLYKSLVLNPRVIGGWISSDVDNFYNLYAGGLPGLRGYSFYSLGGTKKAAGRLSLRFPIITGVDWKWGPLYLDRIHGAVFSEAGNAWSHTFEPDKIKKDVGGELRLKLFAWYGYPMDIQLTGAYGLDKFTVRDDTGGLTEYGRKWRWYFTVLFDFI